MLPTLAEPATILCDNNFVKSCRQEEGHISRISRISKNKCTPKKICSMGNIGSTPPPSHIHKWLCTRIPYYQCSNPGGDCYWVAGRSKGNTSWKWFLTFQPAKFLYCAANSITPLVVHGLGVTQGIVSKGDASSCDNSSQIPSRLYQLQISNATEHHRMLHVDGLEGFKCAKHWQMKKR